MLTFTFKNLSEEECELLKGEVERSNEGLLHDLLIDDTGYYALVEEEKEADFTVFLDKIGVDVK